MGSEMCIRDSDTTMPSGKECTAADNLYTEADPEVLAPRCFVYWSPTLHCGLRNTKKLTGSDFISNIKKVYLHNF